MRTRPSRDYDPEMPPIESVTRYVAILEGSGDVIGLVPVSVARLKFLEKEENESTASGRSCGTLGLQSALRLPPSS